MYSSFATKTYLACLSDVCTLSVHWHKCKPGYDFKADDAPSDRGGWDHYSGGIGTGGYDRTFTFTNFSVISLGCSAGLSLIHI